MKNNHLLSWITNKSKDNTIKEYNTESLVALVKLIRDTQKLAYIVSEELSFASDEDSSDKVKTIVARAKKTTDVYAQTLTQTSHKYIKEYYLRSLDSKYGNTLPKDIEKPTDNEIEIVRRHASHVIHLMENMESLSYRIADPKLSQTAQLASLQLDKYLDFPRGYLPNNFVDKLKKITLNQFKEKESEEELDIN